MTSPFGTHGIQYDLDDNGEFAVIGFVAPPGVFAEIEDGTYGELNPTSGIGERPNIRYVKRYLCLFGHHHHNMLAACFCMDRQLLERNDHS